MNMNTRILSSLTLTLALILLLNACSTLTIVRSSGEQPAPVEAYEFASNHQPVVIEHVGVEVGVGSPIPVEVVASGTWPNLCSQIAEVESRANGFEIDIKVLASTAESCPPDRLGLPFRFALPLNIVEMPAGTYTITVNGVSTSLDLPPGP
jgi:hypothetical protein